VAVETVEVSLIFDIDLDKIDAADILDELVTALENCEGVGEDIGGSLLPFKEENPQRPNLEGVIKTVRKGWP
jgi:hypothetical protein